METDTDGWLSSRLTTTALSARLNRYIFYFVLKAFKRWATATTVDLNRVSRGCSSGAPISKLDTHAKSPVSPYLDRFCVYSSKSELYIPDTTPLPVADMDTVMSEPFLRRNWSLRTSAPPIVRFQTSWNSSMSSILASNRLENCSSTLPHCIPFLEKLSVCSTSSL